jgi:transposase InsO family protein
MQSKGIVRGMEHCNFRGTADQECECCKIMKSTRIKFNKQQRERAPELLDVIHSDICGPIQEDSISGAVYILTFIDDASRKSDVYLLRNKSEVYEKFLQYKARAENETGKKIKVLRSDNGGEYMSKAMKNYFDEQGIKHEFTTIYTPQQNGVAERLNRTLLEKARCLLRARNVPLAFWGEAIKMANFLRNHLATKICEDKTPIEIWTGRKPSIAFIKTFGCKAFVHIPRPYWEGKLGPRAERGMFLGFDENRKAAIIWILDSCKIVTSRDVKYNEDEDGWKETFTAEDEQCNTISINLGTGCDTKPEVDPDAISIDDLQVENIIPDGSTRRNSENTSTKDSETEEIIVGSRYDLRPRTSKV